MVMLLIAGCAPPHRPSVPRYDAPVAVTDVTHFWEAVDSLRGASTSSDSAAVLRRIYLDRASLPLQEYIAETGPLDLLDAVRRYPAYLTAIREESLELGRLEASFRNAVQELRAIHPDVVAPPIAFVFTGFRSQGYRANGAVVLSLEMLSASPSTPRHELPFWLEDVDLTAGRIPCLAMHETVHYQHDQLGSDLLSLALYEGIAEFISAATLGCEPGPPAAWRYGEENELTVWNRFRGSLARPFEQREWLYNSGLGYEPAGLGYWVGFQVAASYYRRHDDKRQALRDMLLLDDPVSFLSASGYEGRE